MCSGKSKADLSPNEEQKLSQQETSSDIPHFPQPRHRSFLYKEKFSSLRMLLSGHSHLTTRLIQWMVPCSKRLQKTWARDNPTMPMKTLSYMRLWREQAPLLPLHFPRSKQNKNQKGAASSKSLKRKRKGKADLLGLQTYDAKYICIWCTQNSSSDLQQKQHTYFLHSLLPLPESGISAMALNSYPFMQTLSFKNKANMLISCVIN